MKKFEVFLYVDRLESNGQYIGKTRRYDIMAENEDKAFEIAFKENPWARGCWVKEVEDKEEMVYVLEIKYHWATNNKWYSGGQVLVKAKNVEQAKKGYNKSIKGKHCDGNWLIGREIKDEGVITYGQIEDVRRAHTDMFQYDATKD